MEIIGNRRKIYFLTISYLFSIPKNCSNLKFHCPLEVLHLEKLEKIFFQVGKKIVLLGKIFFLVGNFFFLFFHTKRQEKLKKYFVTIIVLTFHCSNNLFQCNFEIFQGTEAKKSESQKHYKFLAFGLEFAKLFLDSLFLTLLPWKNSKLHQNKFFSQQVRTIMVTKYQFFPITTVELRVLSMFIIWKKKFAKGLKLK